MPVLSIIFWAFFASYIVHIIDETLINGGLVDFIKLLARLSHAYVLLIQGCLYFSDRCG